MLRMMMKVAFAMTCVLVAVTTADAEYRPWPAECVDVANVMVEQCKMFFVHQESPPTAECCHWFSSRRSNARERRRLCRCMEFLTTAIKSLRPDALALSDQCHFSSGFPMSRHHTCAYHGSLKDDDAA